MRGGPEPTVPGAGRSPVRLVSHGSPMVALEDDDYTRALGPGPSASRRRGRSPPSQRTGKRRPPSGARRVPHPATIHDFYGFPPALYRLGYPAPGAPGLASAIIERLRAAGIPAEQDPERGLDHGVWVPLRFLFPRPTCRWSAGT
jgi:4,5-DOPA dioxygenase extradiol